MCGFAGVIGQAARDSALLGRMGEAIAHRGPDDGGIWQDVEAGVGLASRRLAIIDLSPHGHQPMLSADGRFVIAFNGEIYNHREIRADLAAPPGGWRGHSDTETLIEAIAAWGLDATLAKSVGMFAFALWDRRERLLLLVRDRFGEKPLYYGWAGRDFVFASELKALRQHPDFDPTISRAALRRYASLAYVPTPLSIHERIFKLSPANILTLKLEKAIGARVAPPDEAIRSYWSYLDVVRAGMADPIRGEGEALDALDHALGRAIRAQAVADVPVGAFLSGGVDSSTVCAFYQKHHSTPIRTFTIGFEEAAWNEADDARAVAAHFGTDHNEHVVRVDEARDVIPLLPQIYDEPFADSSQIPTFLVSRFAKEQVTVALTGDGGDELFGGYTRHVELPKAWAMLRGLPRPARAMLAYLPRPILAAVTSGRGAHMPARLEKLLAAAGRSRSLDDLYAHLLDEWALEPSPVIGGEGEAPRQLELEAPGAARLMARDALTYLPDDILCKVDRASMAVSLETRVPYLDHRVAEVAARIPIGLKIRGGKGKQILRQLLYRQAPRRLFDRPKAGFAIPVGEWITGPLRSWADELLDPAALAKDGYFDGALVQRRWHRHLSGRQDSAQALWAILMFEAWRAQQ